MQHVEMEAATSAKWNEWADAKIEIALNKHRAEMREALDKRDEEIADAVAEELVRRVKRLSGQIDQLRAQMTIVEGNANGRTTRTGGKRRVPA